MDGFWEAIDKLGVDDNPYRAGFLQLVCVADSDAAAERLYAPPVDDFYKKCLHVWEGFAEAPGYRTLKTLEAGVRPPDRGACSADPPESSAGPSILSRAT